MKAFGIFLIILCLLAMTGVGYLYLTANLTVEACGVTAMEATDQQALFDELQARTEKGTLIGTPFTAAAFPKASDCLFYTYTVRLRNNCFLPADLVELQVTPISGDVLQIGDTEAHVLDGRSTGEIRATILTDRNLRNVRELTVTCYFWGLPFQVKTAYGK